jgi:hypothetical protein
VVLEHHRTPDHSQLYGADDHGYDGVYAGCVELILENSSSRRHARGQTLREAHLLAVPRAA